jgi:hypothetical protein
MVVVRRREKVLLIRAGSGLLVGARRAMVSVAALAVACSSIGFMTPCASAGPTCFGSPSHASDLEVEVIAAGNLAAEEPAVPPFGAKPFPPLEIPPPSNDWISLGTDFDATPSHDFPTAAVQPFGASPDSPAQRMTLTAVPLPVYSVVGLMSIGGALCYAGARWLRLGR